METVSSLKITAHRDLACNLCSLPAAGLQKQQRAPASLSVSSKVPEVWASERRDLKLEPSHLGSGHSSQAEWSQRRIQFPPAPDICLWRTWENDSVLFKKGEKNTLFYQEKALKESLLETAPHSSNLFTDYTLTLDTFASPAMHKHTCTSFNTEKCFCYSAPFMTEQRVG